MNIFYIIGVVDPNRWAHSLWGEKIASLAFPLAA
jgi:hypothetical protein